MLPIMLVMPCDVHVCGLRPLLSLIERHTQGLHEMKFDRTRNLVQKFIYNIMEQELRSLLFTNCEEIDIPAFK